jgi:excisionase family DNA binding protein
VKTELGTMRSHEIPADARIEAVPSRRRPSAGPDSPASSKGAPLEALVTQDEVRKILRCSRVTLWRLRQSGELRAVIIAGHVLFDPADVRKYIERAKRN